MINVEKKSIFIGMKRLSTESLVKPERLYFRSIKESTHLCSGFRKETETIFRNDILDYSICVLCDGGSRRSNE